MLRSNQGHASCLSRRLLDSVAQRYTFTITEKSGFLKTFEAFENFVIFPPKSSFIRLTSLVMSS